MLNIQLVAFDVFVVFLINAGLFSCSDDSQNRASNVTIDGGSNNRTGVGAHRIKIGSSITADV